MLSFVSKSLIPHLKKIFEQVKCALKHIVYLIILYNSRKLCYYHREPFYRSRNILNTRTYDRGESDSC